MYNYEVLWDDKIELSILMPCLNEAETIETCITKAARFLHRAGINGEIIVADNGSTDGSQEIALRCGARVVTVTERGYGAALNGGIAAALGTFVVMGDADDSYDFESLDAFLERLRDGADIVMGNRFAGGIADGAMPWLHRYVGNPALSWIGRCFFGIAIRDFHCGLRAFRRDRAVALDLHTTGMEWASELVVVAALNGYRIDEVPVTLSPDGRSRPPHLRSFRDGWRHLRFLLLFSPRWLFLYPGAALFATGIIATVALTFGPVTIGDVGFDIGTLLYAAGAATLGFMLVCFALVARFFVAREGFLPTHARLQRMLSSWSLERGIVVGAALLGSGLIAAVLSFARWRATGYGELDGAQTVRTVAPAVLGMVLGGQTILTNLLLSILLLPTRRSRVDEPELMNPSPPCD